MAEKARFVSRYGNYSVGVQNQIKESYATGQSKVLKRRIDANFQRSLVTDDDFAVALSSFTFPGLPFSEETQSHISPRFRVSVWDSEWAQAIEGFTDEEIALIIAKLRAEVGPDVVELSIPKAGAPFPTYDDSSPAEILQILKVAGIPVEKAIAYERENLNRADLLKKLEGVEVDDDAVVVQA